MPEALKIDYDSLCAYDAIPPDQRHLYSPAYFCTCTLCSKRPYASNGGVYVSDRTYRSHKRDRAVEDNLPLVLYARRVAKKGAKLAATESPPLPHASVNGAADGNDAHGGEGYGGEGDGGEGDGGEGDGGEGYGGEGYGGDGYGGEGYGGEGYGGDGQGFDYAALGGTESDPESGDDQRMGSPENESGNRVASDEEEEDADLEALRRRDEARAADEYDGDGDGPARLHDEEDEEGADGANGEDYGDANGEAWSYAARVQEMLREPAPESANDRELDEETRCRMEFYAAFLRFRVSALCIAELKRLFKLYFDFNLPSLHCLRSECQDLATAKFAEMHVCPNSCQAFVATGPAQYTEKCSYCGAPRYKIDSRRRRIPTHTIDYRTPKAFAHALHADPATSKAILETNARLLDAAKNPPDLITDIVDADFASELVRVVPDLKCYDVVLTLFSDSADLIPDKRKDEKVFNDFIFVSPISLPPHMRNKERFQYSLLDIGPKKPLDKASYTQYLVSDFKVLAQGTKMYVASLQRVETVRIFVAQYRGDTLELAVDNGMTGATGGISCLWCIFPGTAVQGTSTYYPAHYAPFKPDGSLLRGDSDAVVPATSVMPAYGSQLATIPSHLRAIEHYELVLPVLENDDVSNKDKSQARLQSGISGRPLYYDAPLYRDLFPWNLSYDSMHGDYINTTSDLWKRATGVKPSGLGRLFDEQQVDQIDRSIRLSQKYASTNIVNYVRSIAEKAGRYKVYEWEALANHYLLPATFGFDFRDVLFPALIKVHAKLSRLSQRSTLSRTAPDEGLDVDLTTMQRDGAFIASLATIASLQKAFVSLREATFYRRSPEFLSACTATVARGDHRQKFLQYGGPHYQLSCWIPETTISWAKHAAGSKSHLAKEISNNHSRDAELHIMQAKFDFSAPPAQPDEDDDRETKVLGHPQLRKTTLHHPHVEVLQLSLEQRRLLVEYCHKHSVELQGNRAISGYGRIQLSNGDQIRSVASDSGVQLQGTELEQKAHEAVLRRKIAHGARFVRCTDSDGSDYYAEVITFIAFPARSHGQDEPNKRLLAHLSLFTIDLVIENTFPSFLRNAPRREVIVGVEELRLAVCLVGVAKQAVDGEAERMAISWDPRGVGTPFRSDMVFA